MKFNTLASVLAACLAAPLTAAPTPEPLEVTFSIDSAPKHNSLPLGWPINLRFVGADPSAFYDLTEKVDEKYFQIGLSALPVLLRLLYLSKHITSPCLNAFFTTYHSQIALQSTSSPRRNFFQSTLPHYFITPPHTNRRLNRTSLTPALTPDHPELSVSYITLTGFALCWLSGVDGSVTQILSYGEPETKTVGPPQVQVNGTCYPHRAAGPPPFALTNKDL